LIVGFQTGKNTKKFSHNEKKCYLCSLKCKKFYMLRIAVQSKGRLYEETMALMDEAGLKLSKAKRTLLLSAVDFPVE